MHFAVRTLAFVACFMPLTAYAEIVRGCKGNVSVDGLPDGSYSREVRVMEMDASGRCTNITTVNNCRVLARLALLECLDALWDERNDHTIPAACKPDFDDDSNRVNWTRFQGIYTDLPGGQNSWIDRVRHEACCNPLQSGDVTVSIEWGIYGKAGCTGDPSDHWGGASQGTLNPNYTIDCAKQRRRGLCNLDSRRTNPSVPRRTNPE